MKKCLKITVMCGYSEQFLRDFIQESARRLHLEGTLQATEPKKILILVCGEKNNVDAFLDIVHEGFGDYIPQDIHVEPFFKDKDYRGIFRILE